VKIDATINVEGQPPWSAASLPHSGTYFETCAPACLEHQDLFSGKAHHATLDVGEILFPPKRHHHAASSVVIVSEKQMADFVSHSVAQESECRNAG
jgi:hypothetical protein